MTHGSSSDRRGTRATVRHRQRAGARAGTVLLLAALLAGAAATVAAREPRASVHLGGVRAELSENFAPTTGTYLRARSAPTGRNEWTGEVFYLDRFDDTGTYFALGNIHQFDEYWFSSLAIGSSSGGFFWPQLRVDGSLNRRLLAQRNLVLTAATTYFDAKDIHSDVQVRLEATYYWTSPWVVQAGSAYNISEPGTVGSPSGYLALSHVRDGAHIVALKVAGGRQAYQPLADDSFQVDIPFAQVRLTWKHWLGRDWGFQLAGDSFHSELFDQHGVEMELFWEF